MITCFNSESTVITIVALAVSVIFGLVCLKYDHKLFNFMDGTSDETTFFRVIFITLSFLIYSGGLILLSILFWPILVIATILVVIKFICNWYDKRKAKLKVKQEEILSLESKIEHLHIRLNTLSDKLEVLPMIKEAIRELHMRMSALESQNNKPKKQKKKR